MLIGLCEKSLSQIRTPFVTSCHACDTFPIALCHKGDPFPSVLCHTSERGCHTSERLASHTGAHIVTDASAVRDRCDPFPSAAVTLPNAE
jgi:hypothetical protein